MHLLDYLEVFRHDCLEFLRGLFHALGLPMLGYLGC